MTSTGSRLASTVIAVTLVIAVLALPARGAVAQEDDESPPPPDAASLTIVSDAHDTQDFAFTADGEGVGAFVLDDDSDPTLSNTLTFADLGAGTYTVAQDVLPGWKLQDVSCTTDENVDLATRAVTVSLTAGEHVTCTFTNAPDRPLVGAIRWDAWNDGPVGREVEWTLGPTKWNYRLPWYATLNGPDDVQVRADNQAVADAEIVNAANLGIDYFAFVWYNPLGAEGTGEESMSRGLRLYRASANRDLVRYTIIITPGQLRDRSQKDVVLGYLRDPSWVHVDGRPLLFVGLGDPVSRQVLDDVRARSIAQGTGDPYIVNMTNGNAVEEAARSSESNGFDAVSAYATGSGGSPNGSPYSSLTAKARATWNTIEANAVTAVPTVMTGWDPRPRVDRPVSWGSSGSAWYTPATPDELAAHFREALVWARSHAAKAVIAYAWNEYDEGGWLSPSLAADDGRLTAARNALSVRSGPAISVTNAAAPEGDVDVKHFGFTVSLSSPSAETVTVHVATVDKNAIAPDDYAAVDEVLTFAPGTTTQTVSVDVHGDAEPEDDEAFGVVLQDPQNATILRGEGVGTITNDDGPPLAAPTITYLSDLTPTSATNGYGPIEHDQSNGNDAAGDGHPITLNGVTFTKGLGVHAASTVVYPLSGAPLQLFADVGVDDECGTAGSVVFQVLVDGVQRFDSGTMRATTPTKSLSVSLAGAKQLSLRVTNAGDGKPCDHADWAGLRWATTSTATSSTSTTSTSTTSTSTSTTSTSTTSTSTTSTSTTTTTTTAADETPAEDPTTTTLPSEDPPTTTTTAEPPTTTVPVEETTTTTTTTTATTPTSTTTTAPTVPPTTTVPTTTTTLPPPPPGTFLSDLTPTSAVNGFGPIERDQSNGNNAAGDGHPITLNGVTFTKGLGVHAASTVIYPLSGAAQQLLADVGVDDECGTAGTVVFQVFVDGTKRFDSGTMTATSATKPVAVSLTGAKQLSLKVTNAGDGAACDHADWAYARLGQAVSTTTTTTTTAPVTTATTASPPPTTVPAGDGETEETPTTTVPVEEPPPTTTTPTTTTPTTITTLPSPPSGTFLSDLTPTSVTNGFGPLERDRSNGNAAAGDGATIQLNGVTSAKGLGVHSASAVTYSLGSGAQTFVANVGVDDECGSAGTVVFQVFTNGTKRYDSGTMKATSATKAVSVNVVGATQLTLKVTNAGDGATCDHADWANARLTP